MGRSSWHLNMPGIATGTRMYDLGEYQQAAAATSTPSLNPNATLRHPGADRAPARG
jgi:hypothetical protein